MTMKLKEQRLFGVIFAIEYSNHAAIMQQCKQSFFE